MASWLPLFVSAAERSVELEDLGVQLPQGGHLLQCADERLPTVVDWDGHLTVADAGPPAVVVFREPIAAS